LCAGRAAIGPAVDLMVDANQSMPYPEAKRRPRFYEPFDLFWLEEPLPAGGIAGRARLAASTTLPIAVSESIYALGHFREYLTDATAGIVRVDAAPIGGVTPWLKTAHLVEAFNVEVAPHFLMELHMSLAAAILNALYIEYIPQLRAVTTAEMEIAAGHDGGPSTSGLGIAWDDAAIASHRVDV